MRALILAALALTMVSTGAQAQPTTSPDPLSSRVKSAAFLEVIATRGLECDLILPWQAAALRALILQDMDRLDALSREAVVIEAQRRIPETACDAETLTLWIDAARPGFDREMLPPYLVAYRTLVGYEDPPKVFTQTTVRVRYGPAVEAINAKLAALEEAGVIPEGGMSWPEYGERTAGFVRGFVSTLANPDADLEERRQAAAWLAQTAHIIELWLMEEGV